MRKLARMTVRMALFATAALALSSQSFAQTHSEDPLIHAYSVYNCGNGKFAALGYPDYGTCYAAAVAFFESGFATGGGGGSEGVPGVGGGTAPGFIRPPNPDINDCTAGSRLCDHEADDG